MLFRRVHAQRVPRGIAVCSSVILPLRTYSPRQSPHDLIMSITDIEQRCNVLRQDLKAWEKQFAAQNEGRKAGRDDIKGNTEICTYATYIACHDSDADLLQAQKYKEYNKLRVRLSSKADPQTPSKRAPRPKSSHDVECTPKALPKPPAFTPTKRKRVEEDAPENVDPAAEFLVSPQGPSVIGPTPQRDGIVLGLFDLLAEGTPSKRRVVLGDAQLNVPQTPSKNQEGSVTSHESRARGERTPLSSGKRFLLNQFVTPKKRKLGDQGTPSTVRGLATPAFLRRDNMLEAIEEDNEPTPRPAPWKRRGLGRSLSSMIQAMKKDEDDRLDEEADIMREMEMEEQGIVLPKKPKAPKILVEDSQMDMPLGPDRGVETEEDSDEEPALGRDGKPRKAWKKKGLKRQTRRVISKIYHGLHACSQANHVPVRPNIAKPKPEPVLQAQDESENEEAAVPETQVPANEATYDIESDDDGSSYASDASHTPKTRKTTAKKAEESKEKPNKEGVVKKAARKIKATANANYRRLNIKGKAGTGAKGKFGRRR